MARSEFSGSAHAHARVQASNVSPTARIQATQARAPLGTGAVLRGIWGLRERERERERKREREKERKREMSATRVGISSPLGAEKEEEIASVASLLLVAMPGAPSSFCSEKHVSNMTHQCE